ncbi:hypothetical protein K0B03_02955 [Patescibacteria group bacterium]|nr:hypothetical protein [Patescibacteria group bacterium]
MITEYKDNKLNRKFLAGKNAKNLLSLSLLLSFALILWKTSIDIDKIEVNGTQISNYDELLIDPNEKVRDFKRGTRVIEIIENKQFSELKEEDNLVREGQNVKEGNLFVKKF